ncbi:hypothetical protein OH76DRAFT_1475813 [Lentinus brumalis]|uniref:Uncharacterized protein n=1 Tax=Lentinus brumalis TaxID=2498619 RepID=A0A371CMA4_9APHY|nr:hypothetical protein OH76DRAFT_1475813 [Polyporus brumalis]
MDAHLSTLLELIAFDDGPYDEAKFRAVYNHVEDTIKPDAPSSACPPLPVLVYAIRHILEPSFILQEIPPLLRLIVHLELIRQRTVSTMQRMLRDADDPDVPLSLSTEDHHVLAQLTGAKRLAAQRTVYRKIVNGCSLLHIHHLWRIYDPETDAPLTTALINYFPAFVMRDPDMRDRCRASLKTHPWHYGLTDEERAANRETGQRAAEFIVGASQYLEDPAAYCSDNEFAPDTPFDEMFPPPDAAQIGEAVMRYIKMVKTAADALEGVLAGFAT